MGGLHIDYGSGLGDYVVERALRDPDSLFVGVESEAFCIDIAWGKAREAGATNARFMQVGSHTALDDLFIDGEAVEITLNFPTPHPHARDEEQRLTNREHLLACRRVLAPGGILRLKTDSQPLRDYTLLQLEAAGFVLEWSVDDIRDALPDDPVTGYEQRLSELGAPVLAFQARVGGKPSPEPPDVSASLFDYLPDDLESLDYIPADMERSVRNLIEARQRVEEGRRRRMEGQDVL